MGGLFWKSSGAVQAQRGQRFSRREYFSSEAAVRDDRSESRQQLPLDGGESSGKFVGSESFRIGLGEDRGPKPIPTLAGPTACGHL
jgi:hypothetical protein